MNSRPHTRVISPRILYFGTPVALLSTLQPDGAPNLTPFSSIWALGDRLVIGLVRVHQGMQNLLRTGEAVVNLPSPQMWEQVERLGPTTGSNPVPEMKRAMGYVFEPRKFERAGLTPVPAETVSPPRVASELALRNLTHACSPPDRRSRIRNSGDPACTLISARA